MMIDEFVSSKGTVVSSTKVCTSLSLAVSLLEFIIFLWFCFGRLAGSTDHRGTPEYPGRTVTLEPAEGEICWGVAYKVSKEEDEQIALTYLEVREKQYDKKAYLDVYAEPMATTPVISGVMVYIASPDKKLNRNYLGPASVEEIAKQIVQAEGPSGPNREYLFQLEQALLQMGCEDKHVMDLANEVRRILSEKELTAS
ncbi:hypothetical protein PVL29_023294 [Vitis rotundifolia]|uniref:glutathione-specific gamma-glutamylcyclotransferase n=1 Tax=Vitis rotundifolia TaxID=103349 RepID=A0AA38YNC9_VITRO|nr:hypothetical protein PVL29_023294 [Vitis rotundifolia]